MRKKHTLWLAAPILAVLAVFLLLREQEPVYQGQPLRVWLANYTQIMSVDSRGGISQLPGDVTESRRRADEAIAHIGTNAIPTLIKLLEAQDSPFKLKLIALLQQQNVFRPPQQARFGYSQAGQAFTILGASASNAVPDLVRAYNRNVSPYSRSYIIGALGDIGANSLPAAIPVLMGGATNGSPLLKGEAFFDIGRIHGRPDLFVPVLINGLTDPIAMSRRAATRSLGQYGAAAKSAVPALLPLLHDSSPMVSQAAAKALKQIDPEAAAQAGVK